MNTLTNRQKEIFDFIKSKISDEGYPPTRMEISKFFGFKSPNAAEDHLKALKKKGFINILSGTSRGISLSDDDDNIPVIGLVSAGSPMLAEENVEKKIPALPISSHGVDYYLRVIDIVDNSEIKFFSSYNHHFKNKVQIVRDDFNSLSRIIIESI